MCIILCLWLAYNIQFSTHISIGTRENTRDIVVTFRIDSFGTFAVASVKYNRASNNLLETLRDLSLNDALVRVLRWFPVSVTCMSNTDTIKRRVPVFLHVNATFEIVKKQERVSFNRKISVTLKDIHLMIIIFNDSLN